MRRLHWDKIGWHVFSRGVRRLELFRDAEDYQQFLVFLKYSLSASGSVLWAFTLMSNHYHLVIYCSSKELTACMHRLNGLYSAYHNRRYGMTGHSFDSPYHAYPQPSPLLLLRVISYVFLNPVSAGLAPAPELYAWSCFKSYLGLPGSPLPGQAEDVMSRIHPDPKVAWAQFHRAMTQEGKRPQTKHPGSLTMVEAHAQQFDWLLEHAKERQNSLGGEDPTLVAAHWARHYGICPRAIAQVLGEESVRISRMLYKFRKRLLLDPALQTLLAPP